MVTVAKADDTVSVLLHFLRMLSFESWIITFKLKKFVFQRQMLRGAVACPVSFLWYCWQVEGVTMAVEWGGRAFHGSSSSTGRGWGAGQVGSSLIFRCVGRTTCSV